MYLCPQSSTTGKCRCLWLESKYVRYWLRSCWEFQLLAVKQWTVSWVFKTWHDFFELAGREGESIMLHFDNESKVWTAFEGMWIEGMSTFMARQPVFRATEDILAQHRTNWLMNENASAEVEPEDAPAPDWQGALSCMTENVVRVGRWMNEWIELKEWMNENNLVNHLTYLIFGSFDSIIILLHN